LRIVERQALVPFSAAQLYALVSDFERYPEFLPWCTGARLLSRDGDALVAQLDLARGGLRSSFTTRNTLVVDQRIDMSLVSGPFRTLDGGWQFTPIADRGCRVDLRLRFEMQSGALGLLLGPVFEQSCTSLMDAFLKRARQVYAKATP
jgi:ribosome-associated toxin RatA of RatAB toxin-antitoxin module